MKVRLIKKVGMWALYRNSDIRYGWRKEFRFLAKPFNLLAGLMIWLHKRSVR